MEKIGDYMDSILTSIKKMLGLTEKYDVFDSDIIMHINSVFMILTQLGIGPEKGFSIKDKTTVWNDFISESNELYEGVRSYMYWKVRMMFDPPTISVVADAANRTIAEFEWRLNFAAEINGGK